MHQWIGGQCTTFNGKTSTYNIVLLIALSPKKYTVGDIDILSSCQHKGTCFIYPFVSFIDPFVSFVDPFVSFVDPFVSFIDPFISFVDPFVSFIDPFVSFVDPFVSFVDPFVLFVDPFVSFINLFLGWLVKEGKIRRKRFFVLTENNQIQYFKTDDTRQPVSGTILLNCLCAIDPYDDDEVKETGQTCL